MELEPIYNWTKDYFNKHEEECCKKLKNGLTIEEKIELRSNLHFKQNNSLVLLNHFMIIDIKEPEFYCAEYEVTQADGTVAVRNGKFSDTLNIMDDETCEDPATHLAERQIYLITESDSNNSWIKDYNAVSMNSNKRKIEDTQSERTYLLKVYDSTEIRLNQFVEVIGFLQANASIQIDNMEQDEDNAVGDLPAYTIHAISFVEMDHNNPIVIHEPECSQEHDQSLEEIRQDLMKLFTQFLFGDEVSAHYLMCHLISCIYARINDEALGKFSLNLITRAVPSEVMTEYVRKLYNLFELLVPNSLYFPMTIEGLNTTRFIPRKDYVTNRLTTGVLQLPRNTHVILDETKLENGRLDEAGCTAVKNLSDLIRNQKLDYNFQFYEIPFKTDIPVLTISEGRSFLPSDYAVPVKPIDKESINLINEHFAAGIHYMRPKLNAYRRYLTKCRLQSFDINDDEIKMIESDFAKMREHNSNVQVQQLHLLLVLSRLIGISKGLQRLDVDSWETAKRLELERMDRMEHNTANEP
ncbi:mini-chromosome maintenance complex-binding protein [Chironomus tepperi]|uniref:mini-chromosome maintenance complex-binding protein n=1 Tax=Chironomus tepperi TaxID=113505 RepID=UPI00391F48A2